MTVDTDKYKKMLVSKDGNEWCFTLPDFDCLQTSPAEFVHEDIRADLDLIYQELMRQKTGID